MDRVVGGVAAGLGHAIRFILLAIQGAVLASGPLLVYYGLTLIYRPAAYLAVGLFLTWLAFKPKRGAK